MARIEEFDISVVRHIQSEVNGVLKQIGEAHGINLQLNRITYDKLGFKGYIEAQTVRENEQGGREIDTEKKFEDEFKRNCSKYGLKPTHLGSTLSLGGVEFILIGLKSRARAHKFVCKKRTSGKLFRFNVDAIKIALNLI